jgi:hypothetical protein
MPASSVVFSTAARLLAAEARRLGLTAPGFRSPPRGAGVDRSIRRFTGGGAVVAVRLRGRPVEAVLADMVDGVLAANSVEADRLEEVRAALVDAVSTVAVEEVDRAA